MLSPMALSPYTAQMFLAASIELKEKNMSEMFQFLHLALHFLASMAPLTVFKWKKLQYVNSITTVELQIENDNR